MLKMDEMGKAQGEVIDIRTLDFKSLDVWEYIWKSGSAVWHKDFVHVYVDNVTQSGAATPSIKRVSSV